MTSGVETGTTCDFECCPGSCKLIRVVHVIVLVHVTPLFPAAFRTTALPLVTLCQQTSGNDGEQTSADALITCPAKIVL